MEDLLIRPIGAWNHADDNILTVLELIIID